MLRVSNSYTRSIIAAVGGRLTAESTCFWTGGDGHRLQVGTRSICSLKHTLLYMNSLTLKQGLGRSLLPPATTALVFR